MSRISLHGVGPILSDLRGLESTMDSLKLNMQNLDSLFAHLESLSDCAALRNLVLDTRSHVEKQVSNSPSHQISQKGIQYILHL